MIEVTGVDSYNLTTTGGVAKTLTADKADNEHIPCVIIGGVWTLDEKMGQTYISEGTANTLAARDYKQPQTVVYCLQGAGETSLTCHGSGINEDVSFTLNSTDVHGVAYENIQ